MRFSDLFKIETSTEFNQVIDDATLTQLVSRADRICRALGLDPTQIESRASDSSPLPPAVMEEISAGRMIQAIKLCRELTGCDLKTAKFFVESAAAGKITIQDHTGYLMAKLDAILAKVATER